MKIKIKTIIQGKKLELGFPDNTGNLTRQLTFLNTSSSYTKDLCSN